MTRAVPISVIETPEFLSATCKLMTDEERALLVDYLAYNPTSGDLIPGTGGVRKLRWGLEGRGKRGGARAVYFYQDAGMPLFALTAYAKNERADLSQQDRNDFRQLTALLVEKIQEEKAMSKVADSIRRGLREAVAYAEGKADERAYRVHVPAKIDVKAIRASLDMTQEEFAGRFGFSVNTLRHWEQGSRQPEGATRAYLLVIERAPKAVQKALQAV